MPKPVLDRFRNYFQDIADGLDNQRSGSSVFPNNPDAGSSREDLLVQFLKNHLPKRVDVIKGGFIFDMLGSESKQMDVIVTNDITMQFKQYEKSFTCIEGCHAAISVKTKLDSSSIVDALENIASIPPMSDIRLGAFKRGDYSEAPEQLQSMPIKIIFAYDSISPQKLGTHVEQFYNINHIPWHRKPDMIVVNNSFFVAYTGNKTLKTVDGTEVPPDTFYPMMGAKYIGAFCLLMMVSRLQVAANLSSDYFFNFSLYVDALNFSE